MKRWVVLVVGIGLLCLAGASVPQAGGQLVGSFQGLGFLSTAGFYSCAWDVSADGSTVVGWSAVSGGDMAYSWTQERGMEPLPQLPNKDLEATADGVSGDGTKIAGRCGFEYSGYEACVWTFDGVSWTALGLGDLAGGKLNSNAYFMNPGGNVAVGSATSEKGTEACLWTLDNNGSWTLRGLGDFPKGEYWSEAYGASADGSVIVGQGSVANNGTRAFRWTAAKGMVDLGVVARRKYSAAWACNADGSVVVGESFTTRGRDEVAFRWTAATGMVGLGDLPGGTVYSEADAVSADGNIVVGGSSTAVGVEAFIWDAANGMRRLADYLADHQAFVPIGWTLRYANCVTVHNGVITIVGTGINPDGNTEAWRAVVYQ